MELAFLKYKKCTERQGQRCSEPTNFPARRAARSFFFIIPQRRGKYEGGAPVTDNIGTVGEILLRHAGSVKKMGTGLYIVTEVEGATMGIRKG